MYKQRSQFIIGYLKNKYPYVDILNSDFVDDFCKLDGVKYQVTMYGANKCSVLGRTLSKMYKEGILSRISVGIDQGYCGMPNWVYSYRLNNKEEG